MENSSAARSAQHRQMLVAVIVVSLLCAPWSWVDDGLTPSWIVYPIVLLVALWRVSKGHGALFVAIAATLFILVHLPWTWAALTGAEENPLDRADPSSPVQWLVTLFLVPLVTATVGAVVWRREDRPVQAAGSG